MTTLAFDRASIDSTILVLLERISNSVAKCRSEAEIPYAIRDEFESHRKKALLFNEMQEHESYRQAVHCMTRSALISGIDFYHDYQKAFLEQENFFKRHDAIRAAVPAAAGISLGGISRLFLGLDDVLDYALLGLGTLFPHLIITAMITSENSACRKIRDCYKAGLVEEFSKSLESYTAISSQSASQ